MGQLLTLVLSKLALVMLFKMDELAYTLSGAVFTNILTITLKARLTKCHKVNLKDIFTFVLRQPWPTIKRKKFVRSCANATPSVARFDSKVC